jgi:hypothetical protein
MIEKDARLSIRLTAEAKHNLDTYCRFTGQKPAEVVRAGIAQIMAPYFGQIMSAPREPIVQEIVQPTTNRLEENKEQAEFIRGFMAEVNNKVFPPRIGKAIKENWDDILDFGVSGKELANMYNQYCKVEQSAGREFCHPNSWITNHGWLNENYDEGTGGPIYDTDR